MKIRTGLGRSCRRFLSGDDVKPCMIAGLAFEQASGLVADFDGDVVLSSIVHAIGTLVGMPMMTMMVNELCYKQGITDSQAYVEESLKYLGEQKISHVAIQIEAREPTFLPFLDRMRQKLSQLLNIQIDQIGISVISGEGLSDVACGEGIEALCLITTVEDS